MQSNCCQPKDSTPSCCSSATLAEPGITADPDAMGNIIWRLGIALVLAGQSMVFGLGINITPPLMGSAAYFFLHAGLFLSALIVLVLLGGPLIKESIQSLKAKRLSLEGLFMLSIIGALGGSMISTLTGKGDVYYEVVAIVLVIYTVGKTLGMRSRNKAIKESNKIRDNFDYAYVLDDSGKHALLLAHPTSLTRPAGKSKARSFP